MSNRSYIAISVAAALALSVALAPEGWTQTPAGSEFRVNTYTTSAQRRPALVKRQNGEFVITWHSDGQDGSRYGIRGQRYNAAGGPLGSEFAVNTYTADEQYWPRMANTPRGAFVVTWNSYGQDGSDWGVFGQKFEANGTRTGAEFQANTYTNGYQYLSTVGMAANGNFVVVWNSFYPGQDGDGSGVIGRRFDRRGIAVGDEFQVNTYTTGDQGYAAVGMTPGGSFVVVWHSAQDGDGYAIVGRRYDTAGSPIGAEFVLNSTTAGDQEVPSVAVSANGSFVVTYHSDDGDSLGVRARIFNAAGSPVGADFAVNTYTTGMQYTYGVGSDAQGNFVVVWSSGAGDGSSYGVFGQRFSATGVRRGAEFRANTYTTDDQSMAAISSDGVGNFEVSWRSYPGQDGSLSGVFAQRFGGLIPMALRVDTPGEGGNGNEVWEPNEAAVDVRPSWRNVNGAPQTPTGTLANITGPPGPTYGIPDPTTTYGTIPNISSAECAAGDCYEVSLANPNPRPVLHWDATAVETLAPDTQGQQKTWRLHIGNSFTDVPQGGFYRFIEIMLHHEITGGCSQTEYCPANPTTREQMSVFVLLAKEGAGYVPPSCGTPVFADVPASNAFCRFIEELFRRGVVSGCATNPPRYCPTNPVTREQMSVFVLLTLDPTLNPPACTTPIFADVPASNPFCRWIEELFRRGVVSGCAANPPRYCPTDPVTREQMSVFIAVTFGLTLYGP